MNCKENVKHLFISQPMKGLGKKEIFAERERIRKKAEQTLGCSVEVIDSYFEERPDSSIKNKGSWYIGKSLVEMSKADVVYFGGDWRNATGCSIEHQAAEGYGISIIEE